MCIFIIRASIGKYLRAKAALAGENAEREALLQPSVRSPERSNTSVVPTLCKERKGWGTHSDWLCQRKPLVDHFLVFCGAVAAEKLGQILRESGAR